MIDGPVRRLIARPLHRIVTVIDVSWITPDRLTVVGLVAGVGSAVLAAGQWWLLALVGWILSRVFDGLDGALARVRRETAPLERISEAGGFLDIVADFVTYGTTVIGVALGVTWEFGAPWWPFMLVLLSYYINGAAFLAFSSIAERAGRRIDDGRSLSFLGRIAEGTETVFVHSLWLIVPMIAWQIAVVWAAFVSVSAAHRVFVGYRLLR